MKTSAPIALLVLSISGLVSAWAPSSRSTRILSKTGKTGRSTPLTTRYESVSETEEAVSEPVVDDLYRSMDEIRLAKQVTALNQLEKKWAKDSAIEDYESKRLLGWTKQAEMYNGRFAMFFVVVGILTEKWTGITFPGQVEEMLRVSGVIGFDQ
eukprot:CAMPEP_0194265558 /NCGR_PEP_ID=MMETSP0169-20130528/756_1 /TAXON_ID=218684 /ORGANISM="Corethron pennatum, Strain L29A3" /LENGTH=153 /DNA_ID=CAMNT_0039006043 /DNA_START=171 /DNA_END=632 /DNA_ORIENTATION=+